MKRILFSTVLLFSVMIVSAQFNLGLKAGYNSSLSLDNLSSLSDGSYNMGNVKAEMWNNFQAGAFARVFIKKFYIQPEILYSIQKKEFDIKEVIIGNDDPKDVNTYMNISSVQVPLYFGLKLLDLKIANLRVFAGPKFIMNSGSKLEYKNLTSEEISASDLAQDFKDSQIDLEAGVGLDVLMFALDAKLNLMQDVEGKIKSVNDLSNVPMPTSTFVISLSWKLF